MSNNRRGLLITIEGVSGRGKQVAMLTALAERRRVPCVSIGMIDPSCHRTLDEMLGYLNRGVDVLCNGYVLSMTSMNRRSKSKVHNEWPVPDVVVYLKDAIHYMTCRAIRKDRRDVVDTNSVEYLSEYSTLSDKWGKYLEEYERAVRSERAEKKLSYSCTEGGRRIHNQIVSEIAISISSYRNTSHISLLSPAK